jgi:RNA polymerase-binding protein DksA
MNSTPSNTPALSPELLTRLRKELADERAAAIHELEQLGADPDSERVAPMQGIDDNFADSAAATAERGEQLAFIENARERLAGVDAALHKMDEGSYGICEVCGAPIGEARLEARPLSVRCVNCAGK